MQPVEEFEDSEIICRNGNIQINRGRWTKREKRVFEEGFQKHGKEWKLIASMIKTRTVIQIRTHAQKYFQKLAKQTGGPVMSTSKKEGFPSNFSRSSILSSSEDDQSTSSTSTRKMIIRKSTRSRKRRNNFDFDQMVVKKKLKSVNSDDTCSQLVGSDVSEVDEEECMVEKELLTLDFVESQLVAAATLLVAPKFLKKISERRLRWAIDVVAEAIY